MIFGFVSFGIVPRSYLYRFISSLDPFVNSIRAMATTRSRHLLLIALALALATLSYNTYRHPFIIHYQLLTQNYYPSTTIHS
jgi:hypothetical protein